MAGKARETTLKHPHIHLPTTRNVRDWFKKTLTKDLETDAALTVFCFLLYGAIFFSLLKAFGNYQITL